jgi:predicted glycoside hydrolase/deacetylase ChbG (UPF0249 family)
MRDPEADRQVTKEAPRGARDEIMLAEMKNRIFLCADDFGWSDSVNKGIIVGLERGILSSTTILVNMGAFEQACAEVRARRLVQRVGLHCNLTDGVPLSDSLKREPRFCDSEGRLINCSVRLFYLSYDEARAIYEELNAQLDRCEKFGLAPTHVDSHHHIHTEWGVGKVVMGFARDRSIRTIRLSRNCGNGISPLIRFYKKIYNQRLRMSGLAASDFFGSTQDVRSLLGRVPGSVEVMSHPEAGPQGTIRDRLTGEDLIAFTREMKRYGVLMDCSPAAAAAGRRSDD